MSVLVVGINYRGAPLELLERFSFDRSTLPKGLHHLRMLDDVREGVILSTCNRTEVYALVSGYHAGLAALRRFLSEFHHVDPGEFGDRLYALYEEDAVAHLFCVASGIDSMVVGEPQILGQVREAFRVAAEEQAVGSVLSALFRHAIRVGRRARSETGVARTARTFAAAGASLARRSLGSLHGRTVLVVGAGKMSDLAVSAIVEEGATLLVASRTAERAGTIAARAGGITVPMSELAGAIARTDLVLTATGSHEPLITRDMVADAMQKRPSRPLVILDLAVPRDVEPSASGVPNVTLRDLDDLRDSFTPSAEQADEIRAVRSIVADEVPRFMTWQRGFRLAPVLQALHARAEAARTAELRRADSKLAALTDVERRTVEAVTRSIVSKLLHAPVTRLKEKAGTAEGERLARALLELFELPAEDR